MYTLVPKSETEQKKKRALRLTFLSIYSIGRIETSKHKAQWEVWGHRIECLPRML